MQLRSWSMCQEKRQKNVKTFLGRRLHVWCRVVTPLWGLCNPGAETRHSQMCPLWRFLACISFNSQNTKWTTCSTVISSSWYWNKMVQLIPPCFTQTVGLAFLLKPHFSSLPSISEPYIAQARLAHLHIPQAATGTWVFQLRTLFRFIFSDTQIVV